MKQKQRIISAVVLLLGMQGISAAVFADQTSTNTDRNSQTRAPCPSGTYWDGKNCVVRSAPK
jgi:hypothetical protein